MRQSQSDKTVFALGRSPLECFPVEEADNFDSLLHFRGIFLIRILHTDDGEIKPGLCRGLQRSKGQLLREGQGLLLKVKLGTVVMTQENGQSL